MRTYDLVVVLRPSLKDAEVKKQLEGIKTLLDGAKIAKEEEWGQKPLAYSIKKEMAGYYYFLTFNTETVVPVGFEQKLLTNDSILRHLLIRTK